MPKYSFRCKSCGYLEVSDAAAECQTPHACRVCGAGVAFHPRTGAKSIDTANWEHLHDCTPARLVELGLTPEQVDEHCPWEESQPGHAPQEFARTGETANVVGAQDLGAGVKIKT